MRGRSVDLRSFVKFECAKAIEAGIKIVVLYKSTVVSKSKCPDAVKNVGTHVAMWYSGTKVAMVRFIGIIML